MNQRNIRAASARVSKLGRCLAAVLLPLVALHAEEAFPVTVTVDAGATTGAVKPIWNWFGYDELNYTDLPYGSHLLASLAPHGGQPVYVRAHHMFTSGDGSPAMKWSSTGIYREDAQGNPIYDFTIADRMVDTWVKLGLTPLMQLGFMPEALSSKPEGYPKNPRVNQSIWPMPSYTSPPKDYRKWGDLCHAWAKHCVERHGREAVLTWRWEIWNEPNNFYFSGTQEEFLKMYDFATDGIRRALPGAIIGGPHTAGADQHWLTKYMDHCLKETNHATGQKGAPLDFIAFHAKGKPTFVDGHVRMGINQQLSVLADGFKLIGGRKDVQGIPVIIGESDPDGGAAIVSPEGGYRNIPLFASYTAAIFLRKSDLAARYGANLEGAVTWAFVFEHAAPFSGNRQLVTQDIDLPVRHVFRMFDQLRGERLTATSDAQIPVDEMIANGVRTKADVGVFAARAGESIKVVLWHYHDDDVAGPQADLTLDVTSLSSSSSRAKITEIRIDGEHGNPFPLWKQMGSPATLTAAQREQLKAAAAHTDLPEREVPIVGGKLHAQLVLPRQAVSLLIINPIR